MVSHPLYRTRFHQYLISGWFSMSPLGDWEMGIALFPGTEEGDGNEAREWEYYSRMSTHASTHTVHNGGQNEDD